MFWKIHGHDWLSPRHATHRAGTNSSDVYIRLSLYLLHADNCWLSKRLDINYKYRKQKSKACPEIIRHQSSSPIGNKPQRVQSSLLAYIYELAEQYIGRVTWQPIIIIYYHKVIWAVNVATSTAAAVLRMRLALIYQWAIPRPDPIALPYNHSAFLFNKNQSISFKNVACIEYHVEHRFQRNRLN